MSTTTRRHKYIVGIDKTASAPIHHAVTAYERDGNTELVNWQELASWQRDNEYIRTGYRPASSSLASCLRSIGHVHNETRR